MTQAHFYALIAASDHGIARDLRARAGGGRYGDKGQGRLSKRLAAADDFQVIQRFPGVGGQGGDGFAGINGAAASDGDHNLASIGGLNAFGDFGERWLTGNAVHRAVEFLQQLQ